ncbi:MAG: DUF5063 domain-containing protein [Muribaculaceae bacterium]|nr:DUF5063 domain-containing protein [Muribaculaceae bacterium]
MTPAALSLTSLAVEYCKAVAGAPATDPRAFVRDMLRYLPRIYITISDIRPYEGESDDEPLETGAIYDTVTEEQYEAVRADLCTVLGSNDVYLDTPVEQMQFSDTPVAVSLAEQLADIYQAMADFAATMAQITPDMAPDTLSELRYRFSTYLADTICRALKAANYVYFNADFE